MDAFTNMKFNDNKTKRREKQNDEIGNWYVEVQIKFIETLSSLRIAEWPMQFTMMYVNDTNDAVRWFTQQEKLKRAQWHCYEFLVTNIVVCAC